MPIKQFDLSQLSLSQGNHTVQVKMRASNYTSSNFSNSLTLTVPPAPQNYLTFSSPNTFSISSRYSDYSAKRRWDGKMFYSTDAINWTIWDGSRIYGASDGTKYVIFLAGLDNTYVTEHTNSWAHAWGLFGSDISCSGNIPS